MKVILFHHLFDFFCVLHETVYHQTDYRRTTYTCRNNDVKTISLAQERRITICVARGHRPTHRKKAMLQLSQEAVSTKDIV